ncbi:hypothetical protein LTR35_008075 [Friedmanniomyces endolithicus]|nr:hypothetical protein LTR35_008075 [Friedmanniomyces endolithicus]KAK1017888.1 hypothetical protein LTR54_001734 [Friedmanniomyces endolithicus]
MGLLKTAIVSGLAIYAVKHLSTAAERRSTPSPSSQYQDHRQPGPRISSYYEDYDQSSSPPRRRQPAYANASAVALDQQYEPQYAYPAETQAARQYPSPPMYRQEEVAYPSQRGFVEPEEKCDPASMSGGRPRDAEYQQAPSSLQSRSGSGEGQKLGKKEIVQDLLAGILRK